MSTRIYIGKITGINKDELQMLCQQIGDLVDFMMRDKFAFAEYRTSADASKAITELDGKFVRGIRITAEYAKNKQNLDLNYFTAHPRIYIGRLPTLTTKEEIAQLFGQFGEIADVLRKEDYCFIQYKDSDSGIRAIQGMNGQYFNGNKIIVEAARPKEDSKSQSSTRLYIGKIGPTMKKQDLMAAFGQYGQIMDIQMKEDYAFIEFSEPVGAARAIQELNGTIVGGSKIVVEESKPKRKDGQQKVQPQLNFAQYLPQQTLPFPNQLLLSSYLNQANSLNLKLLEANAINLNRFKMGRPQTNKFPRSSSRSRSPDRGQMFKQ